MSKGSREATESTKGVALRMDAAERHWLNRYMYTMINTREA